MRRFVIQYRRGEGGQFYTLTPTIHRTLYSRKEVQTAVGFLQSAPFVLAVAVQVGDEQFNIMAIPGSHIGGHVFEETKIQVVGVQLPNPEINT